MKKTYFAVLAFLGIILSGCLDTTQEITINEDGSGVLKNTNDMSSMISMLKQMGGNDATAKLGSETLDTTFSLNKMLDSSKHLTPGEKAMALNGSVYINADVKNDKFVTTMNLPFNSMGDISALDQVSRKLMKETMEKLMGEMPDMGMDEMPAESSIEDYFRLEYKKGLITRSLDKEKYASLAADEYLKGMKEASAMGIPMNATYIINLPAPAKKVEGKNVKVSRDNKQVTVKTSIEDFYEDAAKLEFRIEY